MRYFLKLTLSVFLIAISAMPNSVEAKNKGDKQPIAGPQKILFVGNSFSYFNNGIHNHVANLLRGSGEWTRGKNKFRLLTLSGGKFKEHVHFLGSFLKKSTDKWDLVILQEYSNGPLQPENKSHFLSSTYILVKTVSDNGSKAALFMTWAYGNKPSMTKGLEYAYNLAGEKSKVPVVPVGLAFANAKAAYPEINLYSADVRGVKAGKIAYSKTLKHPSLAGTYLAACVFYASLYGHSPVDNPYTAGLPKETATKLQNIAWDLFKIR